MAEERAFEINVGSEIERYFDDSSIAQGESPRIVILMGGPAGGKTTIRKQRYASGYVLVDAGEIFIHLSRGEFFPFPEAFEEPMQIIGRLVAQRAVSQRRNIITELIGADFDATKAFIDAMVAIGYRIEVQAITCDIEEAQRRNLSRGDDNISCYYAEPYQRGCTIGVPGTGLSYTSVNRRKQANRLSESEIAQAMEWGKAQEESFHLEFPDRLPDEAPATPEQLETIHGLVRSITGTDMANLGVKQAAYLIGEITREKNEFTERKVHEYLDKKKSKSGAGCLLLILIAIGVGYVALHSK